MTVMDFLIAQALARNPNLLLGIPVFHPTKLFHSGIQTDLTWFYDLILANSRQCNKNIFKYFVFLICAKNCLVYDKLHFVSLIPGFPVESFGLFVYRAFPPPSAQQLISRLPFDANILSLSLSVVIFVSEENIPVKIKTAKSFPIT